MHVEPGQAHARAELRRQPIVDCSGVHSIDFNAWVQTGIDPVLGVGVDINGQF